MFLPLTITHSFLDTWHCYDNSGNFSLHYEKEAVYAKPFDYYHSSNVVCYYNTWNYVAFERQYLVL